uniref:BSD domain-containing protein n=1 Tax=Chrysotila carterae TaxID=13221 RepID=A0A7S4B2G2_CHRCT|mmetsp:Transcript_41389/g.86675  ORF Transcript_41389/g.86675 Transcript_41389/m.86675 type:complete len:150 (+) Transcript_41389:476-925(+)
MGGANGKEERPVWPPGWLDIPEEPRLLARNVILSISSESADQFLSIEQQPYCIAAADWDFGEYHAAAAAAMQEDIKLNRLTYVLVPRRISESDFWRLYFSKVGYVLDSVKEHGTYPPPQAAAPTSSLSPKANSEPEPIDAKDTGSCAIQ